MSHDFPDGPDWNPEPIDDDPWDVPGVSMPPENDPQDATDGPESDTDV